jgi:hypothetical protein
VADFGFMRPLTLLVATNLVPPATRGAEREFMHEETYRNFGLELISIAPQGCLGKAFSLGLPAKFGSKRE